jgi:cobalt/nickel transport system ATP-binding protein
MSTQSAVRVENLRVVYPDGRIALDGISLAVEGGDSLAILGANGAGKSTLLLALVGILRGTGDVFIDDLRLCNQNLADIRRTAQLVFQEPDDQLFSPTVRDDVAFGPVNFGTPREAIDGMVERHLSEVGLDGFGTRKPHNLSLGERKRVALAAALACGPGVLLLDEPTAGLDPRGRRELIDLLNGLAATKLVATHDIAFAGHICRDAIVLQQGTIVAAGDMQSVTANESALHEWGLA